ncbi:ATP-binding cassette domain-containing protein [Sharpea porci]|uniref:ABC transporter ATP-binding protein n=1 Tax=Sharpea porci TaxID=2652286 RepID=UPI002A914736|nr:ATP-binding cassette domain-containing protein [Sharpea porci]MDY5278172.1 ATP-binding cassette domain-containing protein [Sharpea porci]
MSVIEIKDLTRGYGHGKGMFDISFNVEQGEVFGFLGLNGAGKTTTIRHLVGFIKNQSGTCTINGHDCWKESAYINKHLGYIPGEMAFFDDMTGQEFLAFMAKYRGYVDIKRQQELFELNPQGKIKKMRKDMKQKLGIISAFMHDPDILILDEPTSALDPLMQKRFIDLIAKKKEKGKTILLSSHIFEEVERTCDRVGIIRQGKMVTVDYIETLRKRHMHQYTVTLSSNQEAEAFAKDFNGIVDGNKVHVTS